MLFNKLRAAAVVGGENSMSGLEAEQTGMDQEKKKSTFPKGRELQLLIFPIRKLKRKEVH